MAELGVEGLAKTFKGGVEALRGISFDVADREAVFLLGPSGAGKTTTLRLIAGLEQPSAGRVRIARRDVAGLAPRERNLAMVYDKHSLFPHLSVFDNLAYPLRSRREPEAGIRARVGAVAEMLQVEGFLTRMPSELSGGQMQRVAIGRALVRQAEAYLLDEPISHLDARLRARMRGEFKRLQRELGATMLYVSHDQIEAMTMADRIVVIRKGLIEQIAAPQALFDRPATLFVATLVGEPPMNTFAARLSQEGGTHWLTIGRARIRLDAQWLGSGAPLSPTEGYVAGIRPQHVTLAAPGSAGDSILEGRIFAVETLGSRIVFDVEAVGTVVRALTPVDVGRRFPQAIGSPLALRIPPECLYLFCAADGRTLRQASFATRPDLPNHENPAQGAHDADPTRSHDMEEER